MQAHEQTQFLQAVGMFVRDQIKQAVVPLLDKIGHLEMQLAVIGATTEKYHSEIIDDVTARIAAIPAGKEGAPGKDGVDGLNGSDADMVRVKEFIDAACASLFDAWPKPKDGIDGKEGAPGKDAEIPWDYLNEQLSAGADMMLKQLNAKFESMPKPKDGKDAVVDVEFWRNYLAGAVEAVFATLEKPQDGRDGRDGADGKDGKDGADGLNVDLNSLHSVVVDTVETAVARLPVPPNPVGVVGGYIDRDGDLFHTLSDGTAKKMGRVVGRDGKDLDTNVVIESLKAIYKEELAKIPTPKDGKDGTDGRDGLGFDDMGSEYNDGKFYLIFRRGDEIRRFRVPAIVHQGIWKADQQYDRMDAVTHGGSTFIAMEDEPGQPETKDSGWLLCIKRGREGKPGERGPKGDKGKDGRDGRDLTQLAFDGSKS